MALLRPRQLGSHSPNSPSQGTQESQPGVLPSMTFPTSDVDGHPTTDPSTNPFITSPTGSPATSTTNSLPLQTTLGSTTRGHTESSSTSIQGSSSPITSKPSP